jgi:hypothetical protein
VRRIRGLRGIWIEVWPNRGRPTPHPPLEEDVVSRLAALGVQYAAAGHPRPQSFGGGGEGHGRSWVGFVPECAVEDVRRVLREHGFSLQEDRP